MTTSPFTLPPPHSSHSATINHGNKSSTPPPPPLKLPTAAASNVGDSLFPRLHINRNGPDRSTSRSPSRGTFLVSAVICDHRSYTAHVGHYGSSALKHRRIATFPPEFPAPPATARGLSPPTVNGDISDPSTDAADALVTFKTPYGSLSSSASVMRFPNVPNGSASPSSQGGYFPVHHDGDPDLVQAESYVDVAPGRVSSPKWMGWDEACSNLRSISRFDWGAGPSPMPNEFVQFQGFLLQGEPEYNRTACLSSTASSTCWYVAAYLPRRQ